ncbi:hypothetical protein AWB79_03090 [Caballeronia hypogeia]|uniref:Zinc-ribbon domain-containing protein n=1 Tax=Caballeronia hypogeia TaxID=1777140 RepID=A0A158B1Z1_9BURK|nr:zinc ribbon domain-containing protein [Caballeronia hypogeia]SAK64201.1 hypothetical protein AWB79_03090 [Caballeronia hypogeia]
MTTRLTFPASMFSVVCQRCGSTVRKNADSCPNCGADRSAAFGTELGAREPKRQADLFDQIDDAPMASATATSTASASASASVGAAANESGRAEPSLHTGWPAWDAKRASERIAQRSAEHRARRLEESARNAYTDPSYDPTALPGSEGWNRKKTIIATACALVLAAGAAFYLHQGNPDDEEPEVASSTEHSVSGAIDSKLNALTRGATSTGNAAGAPAKPGAPAIAERRAAPDTHALPPGDPLQGVRTALDRHDLNAARARLKAQPAQQQTRAEYEALKDELVKRELARDAALQLARACERTSAWACVQQNAGEALALDGSNTESQGMLERVISHAGWLAPTASAALAQKTPSATSTANTAALAPAQANVAAPPAAKPNVFAQKRPAQRNTAVRQPDDADVDYDYGSPAEKFARGQAATSAITAATIGPLTAPTTPTTITPPAPVASVAPAAPQASTQQSIVRTTPAPAPAALPAPAARKPYYLGEDEPQGGGAPRTATPHAPYYLGEDPPAPAPAPHTAVPRPPQSSQNMPQPSATTGAQAPAPSPPVSASAQPIAAQTAAQTATAQRVPPIVGQSPAQASASNRGAQANGVGGSPQFATMSGSARPDADKSDELERAIKQYGWSGGETAPKPSR